MKKIIFAIAASVGILSSINAKPIMEGEITMAFFGGSNMYYSQMGYGGDSSYLTFLKRCLEKEGVKIKDVIRAGKFDQTAESMLARVDSDVLEKKPDWIIYEVSYGFAPHHNKPGYTDEEYRKILGDTYKKFKDANAKVIVVGPSMCTDDPKGKVNVSRVKYNDILREETKKAGFYFLDLFAMEMKINETRPLSELPLTAWGSLYTVRSIRLIGEELVKLCGISPEVIEAERQRLAKSKPCAADIKFSINEWEKISAKAKELNMKPEDYVKKLMQDVADSLK